MCVLSVYARYIFACFFLTTVHINFVIANITVVIFNALSPCRHVAMLPLLTSNKISKKRKKTESPWQLPIIVAPLVTFALLICSLTFVEWQAVKGMRKVERQKCAFTSRWRHLLLARQRQVRRWCAIELCCIGICVNVSAFMIFLHILLSCR